MFINIRFRNNDLRIFSYWENNIVFTFLSFIYKLIKIENDKKLKEVFFFKLKVQINREAENQTKYSI